MGTTRAISGLLFGFFGAQGLLLRSVAESRQKKHDLVLNGFRGSGFWIEGLLEGWGFGLVANRSEIPAIEHPAVLVLEHGSTQLAARPNPAQEHSKSSPRIIDLNPKPSRLGTPSACKSHTRNL